VNTPKEQDRRQFLRIVFDAPVTVVCDDRQMEAKLIDVSLKGALVQIPASAPDWVSRADTLKIQLDAENCRITMEGRAAHQEAERLGFQCRHIDMDSITHLRRLVELNLGDPALLERELEALG